MGFGFEAGEDFAVAADEEFAEVPFGVAGEFGFGAAEGFVEGGLLFAFDVDFVHEGEGDFVGQGAEGLDFRNGAGFLAAEVIAGEAEDGEALIAEALLEGFEAGVLRGVAALRCDIDDEDDFASVGFQRSVLAFGVFKRDVLQGGGKSGGGGEGADGDESGDF